MTENTNIKYNPTEQWWTELHSKIKNTTATLKSIKQKGVPYRTNRGHVVSRLELEANRKAIAASMKSDGKGHRNFCRVSGRIINYRKGKLRHGGSPNSGFIERQLELDQEKINSPGYKAQVAAKKKKLGISEEE